MEPVDRRILEENLYRHVHALSVRIGERHLWNGDALAQAADYIEAALGGFGYRPRRQDYTAFRMPVSNILAEKRGRLKDAVVVGAHYDSVPGSPGADDNASAVAGLIELARLLINIRCRFSFKLAAFANEESPSFGSDYMGSIQYARRLKAGREKVALMIALEMIGCFDRNKKQHYPIRLMRRLYPKRADFLALVSDPGSFKWAMRLARRMKGQGRVPVATLVAPRQFAGIDRSDHSAFWGQGYKAVMITDTAQYRNPHYHRETDTIDTLDFKTMAGVVEGVYKALVAL